MNIQKCFTYGLFLGLTGPLNGCQQQNGEISSQSMADAIHTVLEADRTAYTKYIVNRLTLEENVIKASEH